MNRPTLRVRLISGDVRQGRYVRRDLEAVYLFDGRVRRIPFASIDAIDEVRIPFETCLEAS